MRPQLFLMFFLVAFFLFSQQRFPYSATLTDMDGNEVNSDTFSNNGNPIVVDFWGAFCKPCIIKFIAYNKVYAKWQEDTGVKIIIVSIDHPQMKDMTKKILAEYQWPFETYFDSNQELMKQLADGNSVPRTFVFDKDFDLVYSRTGATIIASDESKGYLDPVQAMYEGSLEDVTADISKFEKELYKIARKK